MRYTTKLISSDLNDEISLMQNRIEKAFGIKISRVKASKVVAWKSKQYNIPLTEETLLRLLGG